MTDWLLISAPSEHCRVCVLSDNWPRGLGDKDKDEAKTLRVIQWFSDTVDFFWQIAKLKSWHWGLVTDNQRVSIHNSCDALFKTWYCSTLQPDQEQPHPKGNTARRLCRPSESSALCQTYNWESQVFFNTFARVLAWIYANIWQEGGIMCQGQLK